MTVGVMPFLSRGGGGGFQYTLTVLEYLARIASDSPDDFTLLFPDFVHAIELANLGDLRYGGMRLKSVVEIEYGARKDFANQDELPPRPEPKPKRASFDPDFDARLHGRLAGMGIDWLLTPNTTTTVFVSGLPYVAPVHDLQHFLQPEFPEVSADGEWEDREYGHRNLCRYATLIMVDSETGKEDVLNCYGEHGVTEDMVTILPFLPANYLATEVGEDERRRVRARYGLPERYFFYPAQFWSHKNHKRIIEGLKHLEDDQGIKPEIVFAGVNASWHTANCFREVMAAADSLGVAERVHYLGFVPNEDMSALYAESAGLVMPTFFGPTNIPILEAWSYGCPVITSDIRGVREQTGDAGLLVDPKSSEAIGEAMGKLWEDSELCATLAARGHERLGRYTPGDFQARLAAIVSEASDRVRQKQYRVHPMVARL